MDSGPIGVFDSGIGGLPVLAQLTKAFPAETFVYFGDNGNVPYGTRSGEEIDRLTKAGIRTLLGYGVKAVVVACNTASLHWKGKDAVDGVPVVRLVPYLPDACRAFAGAFLATPASVRACRKAGLFASFPRLEFLPQETLASEIEESVGNGKKRVLVDHRVSTPKAYDFIYLGCTHYLYEKERLKREFGAKKVFDGIDKIIDKLRIFANMSNKTNKCSEMIKFVGNYSGKNRSIFFEFASSGR